MQKTLLLDTFLEPFHSGIQSTNIIADSPSLDIFKNRPPKSTYPSIVVISHASFHREFANYYTEQNYFRFMFNLPIFPEITSKFSQTEPQRSASETLFTGRMPNRRCQSTEESRKRCTRKSKLVQVIEVLYPDSLYGSSSSSSIGINLILTVDPVEEPSVIVDVERSDCSAAISHFGNPSRHSVTRADGLRPEAVFSRVINDRINV